MVTRQIRACPGGVTHTFVSAPGGARWRFSAEGPGLRGSVLPVLPVAAITTTGKVVLLIVAGAFMVYALVSAMWIPRRNPSFPGKRLPLFIAVSACFFVAQVGAVVWVTSTQEVEHEAAAGEEGSGGEETTPDETTPAETEPTETEPMVTTPVETEPAATEPAETEPAETEPAETTDPATGKAVWASAGCANCHTLADAGATGTVGPNLDETTPSFDLVVERVTNGQGVMPPFSDSLSDQQIQDVAAYVSSVAGTS
jgi:mono/diheme cytochrome c family protein